MAMSLKKQVERANKARHKAGDAIYSFAPNGHTPFNECYKLATNEAREHYEATCRTHSALESQAISTGKAWRGTFNMLSWYR